MSRLVVSEELLQQIESLQMLIRHNVAGMFGGTHQSKSFGSSCEFADYRDYMPGDDISKIDWNAFARFDKLYQKLYLDERQMHTRIYIDASRSMQYGSASKAEQAIKLAAMIAYLSICGLDKVSIYVIREKSVECIIQNMVGKDAYLNNIGALNEITFDGDSYISEALLTHNVGMGDGMSVIISDFLTENDFDAAINLLADKRRDILCVQVLSREEINPQLRGKVHLYDAESQNRYYRKNIDKDIANAYKAALKYSMDRIKDRCLSMGGNYMIVEAEDSLGKVFCEKLVDMEVLK